MISRKVKLAVAQFTPDHKKESGEKTKRPLIELTQSQAERETSLGSFYRSRMRRGKKGLILFLEDKNTFLQLFFFFV